MPVQNLVHEDKTANTPPVFYGFQVELCEEISDTGFPGVGRCNPPCCSPLGFLYAISVISKVSVVDTKLTLSDLSRSLADSSSSGESVRLPLG